MSIDNFFLWSIGSLSFILEKWRRTFRHRDYSKFGIRITTVVNFNDWFKIGTTEKRFFISVHDPYKMKAMSQPCFLIYKQAFITRLNARHYMYLEATWKTVSIIFVSCKHIKHRITSRLTAKLHQTRLAQNSLLSHILHYFIHHNVYTSPTACCICLFKQYLHLFKNSTIPVSLCIISACFDIQTLYIILLYHRHNMHICGFIWKFKITRMWKGRIIKNSHTPFFFFRGGWKHFKIEFSFDLKLSPWTVLYILWTSGFEIYHRL